MHPGLNLETSSVVPNVAISASNARVVFYTTVGAKKNMTYINDSPPSDYFYGSYSTLYRGNT